MSEIGYCIGGVYLSGECVFFFFLKKKTAYEIKYGLVGSEMCIRDRFEGSLTAAQVVGGIREGIASAAPGREVRAVLVADGGDGTLAAAESVGFRHVPVTVAGPTGSPNVLSLIHI